MAVDLSAGRGRSAAARPLNGRCRSARRP